MIPDAIASISLLILIVAMGCALAREVTFASSLQASPYRRSMLKASKRLQRVSKPCARSVALGMSIPF